MLRTNLHFQGFIIVQSPVLTSLPATVQTVCSLIIFFPFIISVMVTVAVTVSPTRAGALILCSFP